MLKRNKEQRRQGQSYIEYLVVTAALVMALYSVDVPDVKAGDSAMNLYATGTGESPIEKLTGIMHDKYKGWAFAMSRPVIVSEPTKAELAEEAVRQCIDSGMDSCSEITSCAQNVLEIIDTNNSLVGQDGSLQKPEILAGALRLSDACAPETIPSKVKQPIIDALVKAAEEELENALGHEFSIP